MISHFMYVYTCVCVYMLKSLFWLLSCDSFKNNMWSPEEKFVHV